MSSRDYSQDRPPPGFELGFGQDVGFNAVNGPFYVGYSDGDPSVGFRLTEAHRNSLEGCHGAVIAGLADFQPVCLRPLIGLLDQAIPTVSLTINFLSPAPIGSWLQLSVKLMRQTRSLVFSDGTITADGELVARTTGIFKIQKPGTRGTGAGYPDLPDLCLL